MHSKKGSFKNTYFAQGIYFFLILTLPLFVTTLARAQEIPIAIPTSLSGETDKNSSTPTVVQAATTDSVDNSKAAMQPIYPNIFDFDFKRFLLLNRRQEVDNPSTPK